MTDEEMHAILLKKIDDAYARVRAYHTEIDSINPDNKDYKDAKEDLVWAERWMFMFKEAWFVARRA